MILADAMHTLDATRISLNTINISELPPAHLYLEHMKEMWIMRGKRFLWKLRKVLFTKQETAVNTLAS